MTYEDYLEDYSNFNGEAQDYWSWTEDHEADEAYDEIHGMVLQPVDVRR